VGGPLRGRWEEEDLYGKTERARANSAALAKNTDTDSPASDHARRQRGAHPTGFSALFACPFCHDTTLQWDCLPSVTESVTRRGSQQKCLPTPATYEDVVSPLRT
jgi:hypothetical protein